MAQMIAIFSLALWPLRHFFTTLTSATVFTLHEGSGGAKNGVGVQHCSFIILFCALKYSVPKTLYYSELFLYFFCNVILLFRQFDGSAMFGGHAEHLCLPMFVIKFCVKQYDGSSVFGGHAEYLCPPVFFIKVCV